MSYAKRTPAIQLLALSLAAAALTWAVLFFTAGRPSDPRQPRGDHSAGFLEGSTPALGQPYTPAAVPVTLSTAQSALSILLPDDGSTNTSQIGQVYMSTYPYTDSANSAVSHTVELWYPSSGVEILEYPLLPPDSASTWLAGERALSVPDSVAPSFVTLDGTTAAVDDSSSSANGESFVGLVLKGNIVVEIMAKPPTTLSDLEAVATSM